MLYGWGRYMAKTSVKDNKYLTEPSSAEISKLNLVQLQYAPKNDDNFKITYSNYKQCFNDVLMKTPANAGTTKAEKYCSCMLDQVMTKYDSELDVGNMSMNDILELAESCI